MQKLSFFLIKILIKLFAMQPLWLLYFYSDIFYVITYYLIGYRKKVVKRNISKSFPQMTDNEIINIEKKFYHHFCDLIFEIIKAFSISKKQILKRMVFKNHNLLEQKYNEGKSIMLISGHYNNWEWNVAYGYLTSFSGIFSYRPLQSKSFDRLMVELRTKSGTSAVPEQLIYKTILSKVAQNEKMIIWLLADQRPPKGQGYWTKFMGQDASFYLGIEKIAKKINADVVFLNIEKVKRGYYEAEFIPIISNASQSADYEIMNAFIKQLEHQITCKPEFYLWSHNRWKYKKEE